MGAHPYAAILGDQDAAVVLAQTPARLDQILYPLSPEQVERSSAPGKWSVREVVAHLADCEIAWSWRLRFAYEKQGALMQPFEQDPWARIYGVYSLSQARATFAALRAWNLAFLGGLTEQDRERPVIHPELPEMRLWTIAKIAAGHDLHHLRALGNRFEGA